MSVWARGSSLATSTPGPGFQRIRLLHFVGGFTRGQPSWSRASLPRFVASPTLRAAGRFTRPESEAAHARERHSAYCSALTGIVVPLADGVFGRVTVRSPFLKLAVTLLASTATGSRTLRVKTP